MFLPQGRFETDGFRDENRVSNKPPLKRPVDRCRAINPLSDESRFTLRRAWASSTLPAGGEVVGIRVTLRQGGKGRKGRQGRKMMMSGVCVCVCVCV
jgi:hypothetical protein